MKLKNSDEAIIRCYREFNTTSDNIATDPSLSEQFTELVNACLPVTERFVKQECPKRVIYLRKKGSLPRLRKPR